MKRKKLLSIFLCLLLVFTFAAGAVQAAGVQPRYTALISASCGFTASRQAYATALAIDSDNTVSISLNVYRNGAQVGGPYTASGKGTTNCMGSVFSPGTYTVIAFIKVYKPNGTLIENTSCSGVFTI